ncbi:MAG: alpha/beta hydrolase [Alphaproteobacteria bacterium]|nr:alpha/beta hydrolase [Alphaproteobacteria bacterium]
MNHPAGSTSRTPLFASLGAAALTTAALGAAALWNVRRARQAERANPPGGLFFQIDGVHLHYLDRGDGPVLVLLHGNGAMGQDFEISGLFDRLAKRYRVIAFDRPGFGHTSRPRSRAWTPFAQAALIRQALARLGIEQATIVGHSWGTLVALALALDHPSVVRGLVLLSGYYFPTLRADVLLLSPTATPILGDLLSHTLSPLLARAMWRRITRRIFAPAPVSPRFAAAFPRELSLRPSQLKAVASDTAFMTPSAAALATRYAELEMPVVLIAGRDDQIVDFGRHADRLHASLPQSELITVSGAGHMIHHTAPEQVIAAVGLAAARATKKEHDRRAPVPTMTEAPTGQGAEASSAPTRADPGTDRFSAVC